MSNTTQPAGNAPSGTRGKNFKYILLVLIVSLLLVLFSELRSYVSGLLGAAAFYVILKDQMKFFMNKLRFGRSLSAMVITIETLLFFMIPLTAMALLIIDTLSYIHIDPQAIWRQINEYIDIVEDRFNIQILTPENLSMLPKIGTSLVQTLGAGLYGFVINILVVLFVLYYMLYSSEPLTLTLKEILPFKDENKHIVIEEAKRIIKANTIGIPLLAFIQGIFAYFGYLFFGVDNAVLYAMLTAFSTIIPIIGTAIVWLPLGASYVLGGEVSTGILLLLYGFFIIGGVDNIARFMLQKILADIHPLITVFGVLAGIPMFGFWGVIFGPLLLSMLILFLNMYRHEYVPGSTAKPRVTMRMNDNEPPVYQRISRRINFKKKKADNNNEATNHPDS